jgi:hypothetical protein
MYWPALSSWNIARRDPPVRLADRQLDCLIPFKMTLRYIDNKRL